MKWSESSKAPDFRLQRDPESKDKIDYRSVRKKPFTFDLVQIQEERMTRIGTQPILTLPRSLPLFFLFLILSQLTNRRR